MKRIRFRSRTARMMIVTATLLAVLVTVFLQQAINAKPSAQSDVDEVWQRAQEIGTYEYNTTILQTTWPTTRLENVGLSSKQDQLYIEGQTNRAEDSMQMKLWSQGGSIGMGQDAIEIKIEEDKALGRVGESEWEEVEDFTDLFAPDNDLLTYLVAAKNVTNAGSDTRAGVSFTRYTFDVDGLAFAEHMRDQMEEEMRRSGELPAAMNIDLIAQYVDMTGTGELWVDSEGLPLRQVMNIEFPPERGAMEWYEAKIETDFSNWAEDPAASAFFGLPRLIGQVDWQGTAFSFSLVSAMAGLMFLLVLYRRERKWYAAFAISTILAMVVGPMMQVHQAYAFSTRQQARVVEYETEQAERESERELDAEIEQTRKRFDPNVSPMEQGRAKTVTEAILEDGSVTPQEQAEAQNVLNAPLGENLADLRALASAADEEDPDDDDDGLTNGQEAFFGSNPNLADSDGDGLDDGAEVYYLGTDPTSNDTDGDTINDGTEVRGFSFNNEQWYLDPLAPDTNKDGRVDTVECSNLISSSSGRCPDTDGDGTPDPFDFDDDNDGVPDKVDSSATKVIGSVSSGLSNQTFNFRLDQFDSHKPVMVDVELRPTNPEHLWYTLNVLDWPSNDKEGQVQRVFDDAFGASGKEANGDLKLVPMLEIEVPYKYAHAANLPVKAGFNGTITKDTPLEAWLDQAKVDAYAMSVRKKDDDGNLLIYVPLNLVQDSVGDSPVAFGARIYYQPNSTDFGNTHKMRLAWLVQAKVDQCRAPEGAAENYCEDQNNWRSGESVIHTYYDDWFVTALSVREEHGVKAGVAFENPNYAGQNPNYEKNLWALANGLQDSFLAGRRDVNVDEIKRRFDKDSNAGVSSTQRWNIPQQALQVKTYNFDDQGQLAQLPMSHTKTIFAQHFSGAAVGEVVNLLFAREERYRTTSLDGGFEVASIFGNSLTINLSSSVVKEEVLATMNWAPYRHEGAGSWQPVDIQAYWDELGDKFQNMYPYQGSQEQQEQNAGKVYLAKNLYLALYQGGSALVEQGGSALSSTFDATDALIASDEEPFEVGVNDILGSISGLSGSLTELRFAESTGARGAALGGAALSPINYLAAFGVIELSNEQDAALGAVNSILANLPDKVTSSKAGPLAAGAILGAGVAATFGLKGAQSKVLEGVLKAVEIGMEVKAVVSAVKSGIDAAKSAVEMAKQVAKATSVTAVIGLVVSAATSVGLFLYSAISGGLEFGSLAFNEALATLVATVIMAVIMFAIAAIPIVGQIIVAIIGLIDAIIIGICKLFGLDESDDEIVSDYICGGISGVITKLIQFFIYSNQPLANLQAEDRMKPTNFSQNLVDPVKGFTAGNQMTLGADVITDLYQNGPNSIMSAVYAWQFVDGNIRQSTFKYNIQSSKSDTHDSLARGQTNWTPLDQEDKIGTTKQTVSGNIPLPQAGINVTHTAVLAEGYAIPVQECFTIPVIFVPVPVCHLDKTDKATQHIDLSEITTYDIFPATLDGFYALTDRGNGAYALAWDDRFPVLMDADGDGLRSQVHGGNDPNDSKADTDGDGLSDFWEIEHAYDPTKSDTDGDDLNDYWETFYSTDPNNQDTDVDGLTDKQEIDGDLVGYDLNANGNPLRTLVMSDPLMRDKDKDQIIDVVERRFDWNPNVPNSDDVLTVESQITNLSPDVRLPNYAKPGDTIRYDATAENHLISRYIRGLLEIDFPVAAQNSALEQAVVLSPKEKKDINGQVQVATSLVESQQISLTTEINGTAVRTNDAVLQSAADSLINDAVVYYKFDQDVNTAYFKNERSEQSGQLFCHLNDLTQCPQSAPGQVSGALFSDMTIRNSVDRPIVPHEFSVGLWVNPVDPKFDVIHSSPDILLGMGHDFIVDIYLNSEEKVEISFDGDSNLPQCRTTGYPNPEGLLRLNVVGSRSLVRDNWNHVVVTYKVGTLSLYINGALDTSYSTPAWWSSCLNSKYKLNTGASRSSSQSTQLIGIDELLIHANSLQPSQIETLYNYHGSWGSAYQSHNITLDADSPTVRLALDTTHIANQDIVMAIEAADLTSNVEKVEYRINNGSWQIPTRNGEVWTFTYQPSGEGEQTIHVRATDSVGNIGQNSTSFIVDGSDPTINLNPTLTQGPLNATDNRIALNGLVSDNSSGVEQVYVELFDYAGLSVSGPQVATLTGNNWQIDYLLTLHSNGQYTVYAEAIDQVGNTRNQLVGTIQVDGTAPQADVTMSVEPIIGIGDNQPTIQGVVSEVPYPSNRILQMHFEEAGGATTFIDGSTNHYSATCTGGACPTAGVSGKYGQAANFSNERLTISESDVENTIGQLTNNFTVMAWVRANSTSGMQQILSSATTNSNNGFAFGLSGRGLRFTTHGVKTYNTSSVTLNTGQWYHLAAVMDNENNVTFYVDGIAKGTISHNAPAQVNEDDNFLIGSQDGSREFFNGSLDEVVVYNYALSNDQIHAIANPVSSGFTNVEIGFLHAKDRDNPDSIQWQAVNVAQTNGPFSTWSYQPGEMEGPHQIHLRTTDSEGKELTIANAWTGEIDTQAPTLSISSNAQTGSISVVSTDYNLSTERFNSPCGFGEVTSREYMNEPWYEELFKEVTNHDSKLSNLTVSCASSSSGEVAAYPVSVAGDVAISGNYAYLVPNWGTSFKVFDINATNKHEVGSLFSLDGQLHTVTVSGNYAYVGATTGLLVIDISTPSRPSKVGFVEVSGQIKEIAVSGNHVYVAAGAEGLQVIDVSTPSNPQVVGSLAPLEFNYTSGLAISGNYAYLIEKERLRVIDISQPSLPSEVGAVSVESRYRYLNKVEVYGDYAYVVSSRSLMKVDISDPTNPSYDPFNSSTYVLLSGPIYWIGDLAVSSNYAYVGTPHQGLQVIDILSMNTVASFTSASAYGIDIDASSNNVYVIDATARKLRVYSLFGTEAAFTTCDIFNNCSERTEERLPSTSTTLTTGENDLRVVGWLELPPIIDSSELITFTGSARSEDFLKEIEVTLDNQTIYTESWPTGTVSDTLLAVPWTPTDEGEHLITVTVSDWLMDTATFTDTIILDTQAPELNLAQNIFTDEEYDVAGSIKLDGSVIDLGGIWSVEASIDGVGELPEADVEGDEWRTSWRIGELNEPPDGINYTLHVTATDTVGRETVINEDITIDAAPPAPFTPTLSYLDSQGVSQVITTGVTMDDVSQPTLTVDWSASSDGSGVTGYLVEWIEHISGTETILASKEVSDGLRASFTAGETQKLSVRVTARDGVGNEQPQSVGPFYVDYATTPSLVLWDEWAEPYRNWTENACNLIGTDYRIDDNSNELAALSEQQDFYSTWNAEGVRLAWAGSDWERDGDLFIYFDTKAGGTERAYNPYPATRDNTIILLPARPEVSLTQRSSLTARSVRQIATTNQMAADYMIWAQDSLTATLMVWDGSEWQVSDDEWEYVFDANHERMTTDIFVPFAALGISEPASSSLAMVALASEDDGLNLWSTMPAGNNVNSERIVETDSEGLQRFILSKRYEWPTLADGICPSGVAPVANSRTLQRTGDALQFTGADIRAAISTDPGGIGYSVLGDNLTGAQDKLFANLTDWNALQNELCEANPEDEACERAPETEGASNIDFNAQEGLADKTDVEHDLLGDKEDITYTIQLFNRGSQPASGVMVDVATWGPVILPDGEHKEDDFGEFYTLEVDVGTLAAGERRTISFTGQTDFAFDPDNNEGWATIDVIVYDDSGSLDTNQIDWLYVDHEIDRVAPDYIEIQSPDGIIGTGENTISGFVFDQSAVPTLTMEVEDAAGQVSSITCLDETPRDKQWSCTFDAGNATEGDILKVRLKATDIHGQESNWFDWQSFIVDGTAPTITLDSDSQSLLSNRLMGENEKRLMGQLSDNRLVSGVEVCTADDNCEAASIVIDAQTIPTTTYTYDDEPAAAIAIGAGSVCESGNELVRTIMVTDSFTIADLDVGLNLDHSYRNDLDVYLKSPAGTEAKLISFNPAAENLDVLLDDASATLARFDQEDHNTAAPYYENQRGAYNLLTRFNGEDAAGNWELTICDYYPEVDHGAYNRSRLIFTAEAQVENTSASWQYQLAMTDEMAHEEQALTIYALDSVGNRSSTPLALNFTIDNVGPVITPTLMPTQSDGLSGLQFAGEASDASGLKRLQLSIFDPNGQLVGAEVYPNYPGFPFGTEVARPEQSYQLFLPLMIGGPQRQLSWNYTDTTHFTQAGTYTLWIEAEDNAGNLTVVGSYELEVLETR